MENTLQYICLRSDWFDLKNDSRKILKIGYEGLDLYLHLFKFRISRQKDTPYIFYTCLSALRKVTGYTTHEIVDLLKILKRNKVIKFDNLSRWDYLILENGEYDDNRFLIIEAIDYPEMISDDTDIEEFPPEKYWVTIDIDFLHDYYKSVNLNKKFYPLYCLMRKLSCGDLERKCYMTIEHMAETIGFDKSTINKMIHKMNEAKVLYSILKPNNKKGFRFDHYLCYGNKHLKEFHKTYFPIKKESSLRAR